MNLSSLVPVLVFAFCLLAALLVVVFLVFDMIDKAEGLKRRIPLFAKFLEKKEAVPALLLIVTLLLIVNGYELATKEVPEIPNAPMATFASADTGAKNAEIIDLKEKLARAGTAKNCPSPTSRKSCTQLAESGKQLAADILEFHGNVERTRPPLTVSSSSPIPQMDSMAAIRAHDQQAVITFLGNGLPGRVAIFERDVKSYGLNVSQLDQRFTAVTSTGEIMLPLVAQSVRGLADEVSEQCKK